MNLPPKWPFRCPRDGWYLSTVDAIWTEDIQVPTVDSAGERVPILVYGTCKKHGLVWLSDMRAYEPELWKEKV